MGLLSSSAGTGADADDRSVDDLNHFTGQFRSPILAQPASCFIGAKPGRVAMVLQGRNQAFNFT
jgi:hypothetical protein